MKKIKYNNIFYKLILIIVIIWLITLIFLPNLILLITSFLSYDEINLIKKKITIINYIKLNNILYLKILIQSIKISIITTICCLLISYPFSLFLTQIKYNIRQFMIFLIILPFWVNSLIRIYSLKILLSVNGILNKILIWFNIIKKPLHIIFTTKATIIGMIYILLPFMILPIYSNLEKINKKYLEVGHDLGANKIQNFMKIILPLSMPGILTGCIFVLLSSMGLFFITDLLGGTKNLLISNILQNQFTNIRDWPFGAAMNVTLIFIMSTILLIYYQIIKITKNKNSKNKK